MNAPLIVLAFVAGIVTIASPCVLPLLPIMFGTGAADQDKRRPLWIIGGFVVFFALFGVAFAATGSVLGLPADVWRIIAVVLLSVFGLALLFERLYLKLTAGAQAFANMIGQRAQTQGRKLGGPLGGLTVGASLGIVWTPCAGPILGSILTLAATGGSLTEATGLLIAFGLGSAIPMLIIAYGGQWITARIQRVQGRGEVLKKIFGALILLTAVAMLFGWDREIQNLLLDYYPEDFLL